MGSKCRYCDSASDAATAGLFDRTWGPVQQRDLEAAWRALFEQGDAEVAVEKLERIVRQFPDHLEAQEMRLLALAEHDPAAAEAAVDALQVGLPMAQVVAARILADRGAFRDALDRLDDAFGVPGYRDAHPLFHACAAEVYLLEYRAKGKASYLADARARIGDCGALGHPYVTAVKAFAEWCGGDTRSLAVAARQDTKSVYLRRFVRIVGDAAMDAGGVATEPNAEVICGDPGSNAIYISACTLPRNIGAYELLLRSVSAGGVQVFLARDLAAPAPGRLLELLPPRVAARVDPLAGFLTEARVLSGLEHENIVRVVGRGTTGGMHYLAMEYVFGLSLAELLGASARAHKPFTVGVLLRIATLVCAALEHVHEQEDENGHAGELVHRGISPFRILVGFDGIPKITGFRIASAARGSAALAAGAVELGYMSPEQALGEEVDHRSDIFSLGVVLWEALTGHVLFEGTSPMEVLDATREQKILPPSKVVLGLSPIVDPIVMMALTRSPNRRYQSASEMRKAIEELFARSGVRIDTSDVAREMADFLGDGIAARAELLGAAAAGQADLEKLGRALGGDFGVITDSGGPGPRAHANAAP